MQSKINGILRCWEEKVVNDIVVYYFQWIFNSTTSYRTKIMAFSLIS